jgi:histone-binding protein RBBP4
MVTTNVQRGVIFVLVPFSGSSFSLFLFLSFIFFLLLGSYLYTCMEQVVGNKRKAGSDDPSGAGGREGGVAAAAVAVTLGKAQKPEEPDSDTKYAIWKSYASSLYDTLLHHNIVWPSLCVSWGPVREAANGTGPSAGAAATGEPEKKVYEKRQDFFFSSRTSGEYNASKRTWDGHPHMLYAATVMLPEPHTSNPRGIGKYSETKKSGKINITKKIVHPGEVNKMRLCPQDNSILATHSDSPLTYIWNMRQQTSGADKHNAKASVPDLVLAGHTDMAEYALAWCQHCPAVLSGGSDSQVLVWSLEDQVTTLAESRAKGRGKQLQPRHTFRGHTAPVEDVDYDPRSATGSECCSVGDDRSLLFWDGRSGSSPTLAVKEAHGDDINCVIWNPHDANVICTGASDGTINLYDLRRLGAGPSQKIGEGMDLGNITNMQWCPHSATHFASAGDTGALYVWDVSRAGARDAAVESWDTYPPELMFTHRGHRAPIVDFHWNSHSDWTIASMSDDGSMGGGTLQMWRVSDLLYDTSPGFLAKISKVLEAEQGKKNGGSVEVGGNSSFVGVKREEGAAGNA